MSQIAVREYTGVETILESWEVVPNERVTFEIFKNSSFQVLAEGTAIAKLQEMYQAGCEIHVELATKELVSVTKASPLTTIFASIFGMQLIWVSSSVYDQSDAARSDLKQEFGSLIWSAIQREHGVAGFGREVNIFYRHDWHPPALREKDPNLALPKPMVFYRQVNLRINQIARLYPDSSAQRNLIKRWLFHALENSLEHGQRNYQSPNSPLITGYHGVSLRKINVLNEENLEKRRDVDTNVRDYLRELWKKGVISSSNSTIFASVIDNGVGIQNSLPTNGDETSDLESLERAFDNGVTRKRDLHKAVSNKDGYGLGDIVKSSTQAKALLVIQSAGLRVSADFSKSNPKRLFEDIERIPTKLGTMVAAVWPIAN